MAVMKWKIGPFEIEFKKNSKDVYSAIKTLPIGTSENILNLDLLTKEELNYIVRRFSETMQSLAFMTMEERIRAGLKHYTEIKGEQSVTITYNWGILGNDLIMWLGEFRKKRKELIS